MDMVITNKKNVIVSLLLMLMIILGSVTPSSAASKTTTKYKSLPANQGLISIYGSYQDSYKDYEHLVTLTVTKKNTTVTLKEYAGGPYIAEYTYTDGHTKKVGKNKKCKYSYSVNVFHKYGYDVSVRKGCFYTWFHTTKIKFKKPGTYTLVVSFRTKAVRYPVTNVNRYVNDKYPTWNLGYDNKRVNSVIVNTRAINRY